jgi:5'-deoxynucleotidase YfbR-like HD superfamily hydrolase
MLGGVETAHPGGVNPDGPTVIATVGGGSINLFNPEAGSVDLEDIASSISKLVRFTGQTHSTITIAEHSVTVLSIFDALYPRAKLSERQYALLHDAHEAYLNDITAPAKRAIEQQVGLEMDAAWEALSPYIDPSIRTHAKADMNAAINRRVVKSVEGRLERAVLEALLVRAPEQSTMIDVKRCDLISRYAEGAIVQGKDPTWGPKRGQEPMPKGSHCYWGSDHRGSRMLFLDACDRVGLGEWS